MGSVLVVVAFMTERNDQTKLDTGLIGGVLE